MSRGKPLGPLGCFYCVYFSKLRYIHWCLDVRYTVLGGSRTQSDLSSVQKGNSCQKWAQLLIKGSFDLTRSRAH